MNLFGRVILHHLEEKIKETSSPEVLFENLNLTPIHPILWTDLHTESPGRPVEYDPEWDLRALMLRQLLQIPYVKDRVKRLKRGPCLRETCGYGDKAPTEAHFSQMKRRIGAEGFRGVEAYLRREALRLRGSQPMTAVSLVQAGCVDGTGLEETGLPRTTNSRYEPAEWPAEVNPIGSTQRDNSHALCCLGPNISSCSLISSPRPWVFEMRPVIAVQPMRRMHAPLSEAFNSHDDNVPDLRLDKFRFK